MAFCGARFLGTANILADRPGRCGRGATLAKNRTQPRIRGASSWNYVKISLRDPSRRNLGRAWIPHHGAQVGQARLATKGGGRSAPGGGTAHKAALLHSAPQTAPQAGTPTAPPLWGRAIA